LSEGREDRVRSVVGGQMGTFALGSELMVTESRGITGRCRFVDLSLIVSGRRSRL
jgi:hypothetical protein